MPPDGETQRLCGFLRYAQASWSERDINHVRDKLARIGIESLPELVLTLRPGTQDGINQRLRAHGEKAFSSDTFSALALAASRLQSPVVEFLRGAQPEWSEAKVRAVQEKIVQAGILDIDELRLTLRPGARDNLNRRLESGGKKRLAQETLVAFRRHAADVGAQPRPLREEDGGAGAPADPGLAPGAAGGVGGARAGPPLAEFLEAARPEWTPTDLRTIEAKLVAVGIRTAEDLVASLLPGAKRHLNKRLRSAGQNVFRSHTILELQAHAEKFRGGPARDARGGGDDDDDDEDEVQSVEREAEEAAQGAGWDAEDEVRSVEGDAEDEVRTVWQGAEDEAQRVRREAKDEVRSVRREAEDEAQSVRREAEDEVRSVRREAEDEVRSVGHGADDEVQGVGGEADGKVPSVESVGRGRDDEVQGVGGDAVDKTSSVEGSSEDEVWSVEDTEDSVQLAGHGEDAEAQGVGHDADDELRSAVEGGAGDEARSAGRDAEDKVRSFGHDADAEAQGVVDDADGKVQSVEGGAGDEAQSAGRDAEDTVQSFLHDADDEVQGVMDEADDKVQCVEGGAEDEVQSAGRDAEDKVRSVGHDADDEVQGVVDEADDKVQSVEGSAEDEVQSAGHDAADKVRSAGHDADDEVQDAGGDVDGKVQSAGRGAEDEARSAEGFSEDDSGGEHGLEACWRIEPDEEPPLVGERDPAQPPGCGGEEPPVVEGPASCEAPGLAEGPGVRRPADGPLEAAGAVLGQGSPPGVPTTSAAGLAGGPDIRSPAEVLVGARPAAPVPGGEEPPSSGREPEAAGPHGPEGAERPAGTPADPFAAGLAGGPDGRSSADGSTTEAGPSPRALLGERPPPDSEQGPEEPLRPDRVEPPVGPLATPPASEVTGGLPAVPAEGTAFQCATLGCRYRVSHLAEKGAYCCLGCLMGGKHGDSCERRVADAGAPTAPRGWRSRPGMEVFELEREKFGIALWSAEGEREGAAGGAGRDGGARGSSSAPRAGEPDEARLERPVVGPSGWLLGDEELQMLKIGFSQQLHGAREAAKAWDRRELFLFLQSHGQFDPSAMAAKHRRPPPLAGSKRVSVVVPTMERRHPWHQQLYETFDAQTWPDKELIVVETYFDKSSSFFEAKAKVDARVIYLALKVERSRDFSIGLKRNMCIHLASGAYVANFDDDDLYAPCYLAKMVEAMLKKDSSAVTLGSWYIFDCKTGRFGRVIPREHMSASNKRDMDYWTFGYGFSYVYTRDVALRVPYPDWPFDPAFSSQEDWEFFTAVRLRNLRLQGGSGFLSHMEASGTAVLDDTAGLCLHTLHATSTSASWAKIELPRAEAQALAIEGLGVPFKRLLERYPRRAGTSEFIPDSSKPPQRTVSILDVLAGRGMVGPGGASMLARPPPLPKFMWRPF